MATPSRRVLKPMWAGAWAMNTKGPSSYIMSWISSSTAMRASLSVAFMASAYLALSSGFISAVQAARRPTVSPGRNSSWTLGSL